MDLNNSSEDRPQGRRCDVSGVLVENVPVVLQEIFLPYFRIVRGRTKYTLF